MEAETHKRCRPSPAEAGTGQGTDEARSGTRHFGIGGQARVAAIRAADDLRARGIAAAALFKPPMGGWVVQIYPGGIRRPG